MQSSLTVWYNIEKKIEIREVAESPAGDVDLRTDDRVTERTLTVMSDWRPATVMAGGFRVCECQR